jgi:glutaredoxin 3
MSEIIIYSKSVCPYCVRAKMLLQRKGKKFTEIMVNDEKTKDEMIKKSNGRMTVPQIFIGDKHVGGCDELYALESAGKLDELLK